MTCFWTCQFCPEHGEGDREAEAHVKATTHTVVTSARKRGAA